MDKFPPCHSSPLDMRPPVCSPLLLQPLAFPQRPCPSPSCTPMCFSNLGQPSQQTARRSPCCCGRERPPVTRDDLGPLGAKSPPLGNLSVLGGCTYFSQYTQNIWNFVATWAVTKLLGFDQRKKLHVLPSAEERVKEGGFDNIICGCERPLN